LSRISEWTPERIEALSKSIAVLILGGIVLALIVVELNLYYVAALAAGAALTLIVAWQFEAVLIIYSMVAFIPWGRTPDIAVGGSGVGKGLYVSEAMLGFLLAIWVGKYLLGSLPSDRISSGFYKPLGLYIAYSVLNVFHSYVFWDSHINRNYQYIHVNIIELGLRILSAGALVLMATSISDRKRLSWITAFIMIPGVFNLLNAFFRAGIPLVAPWWPLITLLPLSYSLVVLLDNRMAILWRVLAAALIIIGILQIQVFEISWVSGWIGLAAALVTVMFIRARKMLIPVFAVVLIVVIALRPVLYQKVIVESKEGGDYDRFALMLGGWRYATTFPLGVGLGNYRSYNSFYYGEKWNTTSYTSAHGTYWQHLAEMGIPGTLLFVAILIGGFRWLLHSYRRLPEGSSKRFLLAAMGQMAGISTSAFVGDYIIPTYHNGGITTFSTTVYSWMIWGLAVAHVRLTREKGDGPIDINSQLEYARSA